MTSLAFPMFPFTVHGALFSNVSNAAHIKSQIISLNPDYDYHFINAANIVSLDHLNAAIFKTLQNYHFNEKKLKTNSLNSEVILNLSPNKNISDALNKFGISNNCHSLVVLKMVSTDDNKKASVSSFLQRLDKIVDGEMAELTDENLQKSLDLKTLKKNYKLGEIMTTDIHNLSRLLVGIISMSDF